VARRVPGATAITINSNGCSWYQVRDYLVPLVLIIINIKTKKTKQKIRLKPNRYSPPGHFSITALADWAIGQLGNWAGAFLFGIVCILI
jgi:hypothetical protein